MKVTSQRVKKIYTAPLSWILASLALITLYFQTNLTDPFNSPKMWILLVTSSWMIGYIFSYRKIIIQHKEIKITSYLLLIFIFVAVLVTLATDLFYTALFGDMLRRNGFVSYVSLAIMMLASSIFIRSFNIRRLFNAAYLIGIVTVIYALMQATGRDFVKWNNPYNSIIGTVGNPNFAAAVMAIIGILIFSSLFISDIAIKQRWFGAFVAFLLLIAIYRSNARQGLLTYCLGVGLFLAIWLFDKNKKVGMLFSIAGISIVVFAILGMLQVGPLEKLLYKPSVSVRGFYWRAGIEMFKNHPLTGVGMDRYGYYFKEYREVEYPLNYGFDITSSNAHNTFLQFFATGGFFLGFIYLVLNGYILFRALSSLKKLSGNRRLILAGVFSAWIGFHAQSLVSIDNLGISIWGWILGGSIIGLSVSENLTEEIQRSYFHRKINDINLSRVAISSLLTFSIFILISFLYRGEVNTFTAKGNFNLQDQTTQSIFLAIQDKAIETKLNDPGYILSCALNLAQAGYLEKSLLALEKIHSRDPRNLDALNALAAISEQLNKPNEAIVYRLKISKLDPWNAVNYLALGKVYKVQGDIVKSKAMLDKIVSFAPNHPVTLQAKTDLAS